MNFDTIFPVHIYHSGMTLPTEGTYFLVAGNGLWLHKDMRTFRGFVPVDNISVLEDLDAKNLAESKLPKIPARHVWRIKEFFRRVVEKYHAEACTVLLYNHDNNDWKIQIPQQLVSHGGVQYQRTGVTHLEDRYIAVGTIHSHCDFNAFHSGTDHHDESTFDGLHITFGHNNKEDFTISASIVINGFRSFVEPLDVLEGVVKKDHEFFSIIDIDYDNQEHEWAAGIDEWMKQVAPLFWRWHNFSDALLKKGDRIVWDESMKQTHLRSCVGEGPFEVTKVYDGKVEMLTTNGVVRLSDKLFKKV